MKTLTVILLNGFLAASALAEFRTWTRTDGKTADLELTSVKGEDGAKIGTFQMRNGKSIELPADTFIIADAELINTWSADSTEKTAEEEKPSVFDDYLDKNLVKLDGRSLKRFNPEAKPQKYYVFYYTASWCGPCQKYTPGLVDLYNEIRPNNSNFELVLITSDRDDDSMEDYAKEKNMPWPQLKMSKVEKFKKAFNHEVTGIPSVVVCDLNGEVVAKTTSLESLKKLLN